MSRTLAEVTRTTRLRRVAQLGAALCIFGGASLARAENKACGVAYEEAQVTRADGQLGAAQRLLESCVRAECPEFIRTDCGRWLAEVEQALPTIVVVAKSEGRELEDVRVSLDGAPLLERIDGKAVNVDPGSHTLRFEIPARPPLDVAVLIHEGEKNRTIEANFPSEPARGRAREAPGARHGQLAPYLLLGAGALAVGAFVTFAELGTARKHELERTCAPGCSKGQVSAVHGQFLIADASLALGVVAAAAGGYLLLSAPRAQAEPPATARVGLLIAPRFGALKIDF